MKFYGMASNTAMERHGHPNREYRGEEGKTVTVPYRGLVRYTAQDILSGIRSACTYVGARRLKDLSKCATFIRVNNTHNRIYEQEKDMDLTTYFNGFFTGAAFAFILVAIWEIRDFKRSLKKYE